MENTVCESLLIDVCNVPFGDTAGKERSWPGRSRVLTSQLRSEWPVRSLRDRL